MQMKLFDATSMTDAIRRVRDTLGGDAIILSSHQEGKGRKIRVTAMRDDADHGMGAFDPARPRHPHLDVIETLTRTLDHHRAPTDLAERLINAAAPFIAQLCRAAATLAANADVMILAAALQSVVRFEPLFGASGCIGAQRPFALIGPPGCGKTLSLAKLATQAVFRRQTVHAISADATRAGAIDQLAGLMRILEIDLQTAEDPATLRDALDAAHLLDEESVTLIDTPGVNPLDAHEMADLTALVATDTLEPILVMPAGLDADEACDIAVCFQRTGARRLLVTRLDTTRRLGSLLTLADSAGLAFCAACTTPRVTDGLQPLNPVSLAQLLLNSAQQRPGLLLPAATPPPPEPEAEPEPLWDLGKHPSTRRAWLPEASRL